MCGITGLLKPKITKKDICSLEKMNDAISHRGPDDFGYYKNELVALGHRRLSIIDLSKAGHQPMTYGDSGFWITYNGEIYNYLELRSELEKLGYSFISNSDTEVILASFIEWGEDAQRKFNGMWAFAIYNENNNDLFISRDRYGIKPLYYYHKKQKFAFSSELKSFHAAKKYFRLKFDTKGLRTVLKSPFQLEASGHTIFKNIYNLLPGHSLRISTKGIIQIKRWWNTQDELIDLSTMSDAEVIDGFKELFLDSCKLRLRSDVPVASSLSGGLDSSSVVSVISRLNKKYDNVTFVHSFDGSFLDETKFAEMVANDNNVSINYVRHSDDLTKNLDAILYQFEGIYEGLADGPYRIYQDMNRKGYKVTMDGHGADEMLAGYPWYITYAIEDSKGNDKRIKELEETYERMTNHIPQESIEKNKYEKKVKKKKAVYIRLVKKIKRIITKFKKEDLYNAVGESSSMENWSALKKRLYDDFHYSILPRILKNFDVMSMANSVEVRMPFLDYRLVNYVFSLPDRFLLDNGYTKFILRESMENIVTDKVRLRRNKIGFNSPLNEWLNTELREWISEVFQKDTFSIIKRDDLLKEYKEKIDSDSPCSWADALIFWKKINFIKIYNLYK